MIASLRAFAAAALATCLWTHAASAQPVDTAAAKARSDTILAETRNADGVFGVKEDGAVLHVQSGMVCAAAYANANLTRLFVFDSPAGRGLDVGCDYSRVSGDIIVAKHTMFAIKLPPGETIDSMFERYRKEMQSSSPNARSGGPSIRLGGDTAANFPELRSEEMFFAINGREYQTEVIVMLANGWIIEIRSTRPSQFAVKEPEEAIDSTVSALMMVHAANVFTGAGKKP